MTLGVLVAGILGLLSGNLLNWLVDRQAVTDKTPPAPLRQSRDWLPVLGAGARRNWFALTVELLTAISTAVLFARHGLSVKFALLFVAALVLIDTGAVDWRVKLIDVLILIVATVLAVATAQLRELYWLRSLQGLATALVLFVLFFVVAKLMYPGQGAPFGLGDVYLGAFIGALVGFFDLPYALFYGMGLAGVASLAIILLRGYRRARHVAISYGTYLCLGTLAYMLFRLD